MDQINQLVDDNVFILPLSAKTKNSLGQYQKKLADYLPQLPNHSLADIAYTLQEKREFYSHRNYIVCKTIEDAIQQLHQLGTPSHLTKEMQHAEHKLIFMFSGQGSQYSGMSSFLYKNEEIFRNCIDYCCNILSSDNSIDFKALLFSENNQAINQTQYAQPLLFVVSYALAKLFESWGVKSDAYIGHSLGEYVAATLANVFSLEDALKIVAMRGKLMQSMPSGAMLAIQKPASEVSAYLTATTEIAVVNSPEYCVVSGATAEIHQLKKQLEKQAIPCSLLRTSHAFHSAMMEDAAHAFTQFLADIILNPPSAPFISNTTGQFITDIQATSPNYWGEHIRNPVLFSEGVNTLMQKYPHALYCEIGPGNTLSTFVKQHKDQNDKNLLAIHTLLPAKIYKELPSDKEDLQIFHAVGKLWSYNYPLNFKAISKNQFGKLTLLPSYQFEKQTCWINKSTTSGHANRDVVMNPKSKWFYKPTWKRLSSIPKHHELISSSQDTWLIFADDTGLSDKLALRLKELQQKHLVVKINKSIQSFVISHDHVQINPFSEQSYAKLFSYLNEHHYKPTLIIHAWTVTNDHVSYVNEFTESKIFYGFYSLFLLQKYLLNHYNHPLKLSVLTNGIGQITGEDIIHPEKGTVLGAVRAIPHELPQVQTLCLDLGFKTSINPDYLIQFAQQDDHYEAEPSYALKMNALWREDIELISTPIHNQTLIQDNEVILITGGLGGIALSIANEIAKKHQVTFVLTSRKPFVVDVPEKEQSDLYKFQKSTIKQIQDNGSQVDIDCIDIAEPLDTLRLIERIKQKYGTLSGIIHAAGVEPLGLVDKSLDQLSSVLSAKVFGTENLFNALKNEKLKYFIMTSSITSFMGTVGTIEYCAANSYLDILSGSMFHPIVEHFLSINWPAWSDVGMAHKFNTLNKSSQSLEQLNALNSKQGAEVFYTLMNQTEHHQVAVSKFDIQNLKKKIFGKYRKNKNSIALVHENKRQLLTDTDITGLEEKVAQIFHEILGVEQFSKHDNFFDLGGSSLSVVQLVSKLKAIDLFPSITDIMKNNSVFLLSNFNTVSTTEKIVVPLKINPNSSKNVFFIHPVGGTLILYTNMIKQLDNSYNYYGIQNINIANKVIIETDSLKKLAEKYVYEIQKIQSDGPYVLMGASLGGTLAYEMGRQLLNLGKQVSFVAMFDSWATFSEKSHDEDIFRDYMYSQMKSEFDEFASKLSELAVENEEIIKNICDARWKLMTLLLNYSIQSGDVNIKIHQFKAKQLDSFHINNINTPDNGWKKYTNLPVSSYEIDGDHISILEQPGVNQIITELNSLLSQMKSKTGIDLKATANSIEFNYSKAI
ncbi:SDR family NAD(P)-dependent oxidoreductase [Legionella anisa]|nr:SDR family NAD(P)-dependent oxidoreductase [Legionella anisa]KTC69239.1 Polyketide synthase module [Legionella anisa]MBN5934392.1 SDR family NAD(P)-dependent oxidoreductase [Legionella anisa]MCW8424739.1 SDR family NAD(P)-dependent oxidoreductase [Legionella anisa]MCW8446142.1 SDR family NAD(P)-dependent oxidoreductase [Legionella anisa]UAK80259.1 SDR family NAD(P)-dependent oxidoreductase [Legionella anisa]